MDYQEFCNEMLGKYSIKDLYSFSEYYQNGLSVQENEKNLIEFISDDIEKTYTLTLNQLEQMFCEDEGILAKFTEVNQHTIKEWLEERKF